MGKLIPMALLLIAVLCSGIVCVSEKVSVLKTSSQQARAGSRTKNNLHRQLSLLKLSAANTDFALRLYRQIASQPSSTARNIFFSPLSISASLAMLSLGAKHDTRDQLLQVLGYYNMSRNDAAEVHSAFKYLLQEITSEKREPQLAMGSSLHIQQGLSLQKKFLEDAKQFYKAETVSADFRAADKAKKMINTYVKKQTRGKIQELIKSLNRNTVMILLNYVLFKDHLITFKTAFRNLVEEQRNTCERITLSNSYDIVTPQVMLGQLYMCLPKQIPVCDMDSDSSAERINLYQHHTYYF